MKNKIAEYRTEKKITQTELAQRVGITRPYLSEIERGIKEPGSVIAKKICLVLKVTFEDLFYDHSVN